MHTVVECKLWLNMHVHNCNDKIELHMDRLVGWINDII
jgi:hypothetical protein